MPSAAARSPSRIGPDRSTVASAASCVGVRPASSCRRSRRDSRASATRSLVTSTAGASSCRPVSAGLLSAGLVCAGLSWGRRDDRFRAHLFSLRRASRTLESSGKAGTNVAMGPSVSYSITVRLEVASRGRAVSEITRAVEQSGGVVTALDVTAGRNDRLRIDVTCAARDTDHAEAIVTTLGGIDGVTVHKVSDRTFLLHLGGKIEMRSKVPLRNRDDLSMAYTPGVGRVAMAIAGNRRGRAPPDHQAELGGRGHRRLGRARPGQYRSLRRAAGHGGQGGPVQAVRRHRRLADLPGQPGHRRDRPRGTADRARVRRHQPGGHQRAALLRGGAPAARAARHPGVPRRPARHRDRGDGRADERAASGGQEAFRGAHRHGRRWRRGHRRAQAAARRGGQCRRRGGLRRQRIGAPGPPGPGREPALDRGEHQLRRLRGEPGRGGAGRRRVHRAIRAGHLVRAPTSRPWRPTPSCSRWPTPTRRWIRRRPWSMRPWWPPAAAITPTRSTTCWPSPACSAGCSTRRAGSSPTAC